jgi:peptidyl-prolyl cis-trans isomerase SurA
MFKKLYISILIIFFFNLSPSNLTSKEVKIIKKIHNEIITNIDIQMEALYLKTLNPKFKDINNDRILELAEQSLIKEKIKEKELLKYFDLEKKQEIVTNYIKQIYTNLGHKSKKEFTEYLKGSGLEYKNIHKKINIELAWNEFIYTKYKNKIKIDEASIKEKIRTKKIKQKSYNLSEILFSASTKKKLKNKFEELKRNILRLGFDKTALLYSESETQKKSGLIGWIDENQLSKKFKNELKLLDEGQITNPINVSSGKIILKINKIKIGSSTINTEKELEKIILQEKDRQLNNFSIIHYNKIKNKLLNKDE